MKTAEKVRILIFIVLVILNYVLVIIKAFRILKNEG